MADASDGVVELPVPPHADAERSCARPSGPGGGAAVLVAAQSGRALAWSARRAGYVPLVADLFADVDTARLAAAVVAVEGALKTGFRRDALVRALDRLTAEAPSAPIGLVLGSGFEDRPGLIDRLAGRFDLLGTPGAAVRSVKNPVALAEACRSLAVPHPEARFEVPAEGRWLTRRIGGSGGAHIRRATRAGPVREGQFATAETDGMPVSLGFVAGPAGFRPIGFCRQWADPGSRAPFRFGGIAGPLPLAPDLAAEIVAKVAALADRFGLVGLGSADLLVDEEHWWLIEINPRAGASLDVLDCGEVPLFHSHVEACKGRGVELSKISARARAAAVVYARSEIAAVHEVEWPDWVFDRPRALGRIGKEEPIATVVAEAACLEDAIRIVERRAEETRRMVVGR